MLLNRLVRQRWLSGSSYHSSRRRASTIVSDAGRVYVQGEVLQHHRKDPAFSIFKAHSGDEAFVLKRVHKDTYDLNSHLATEFADSRQLRLHSDSNQEQGVLVYPFFRSTLLALLQDDPEFPPHERMKIVRNVGHAIRDFHSRGWIHIDIKPDNILVNWTCDEKGSKIVTDAVLGDFDIAFKLGDLKLLNTRHAIGNAMWRSPEGQTARGLTKASDIYSFGLVCLYAFGAGELLIIDNYQELRARKIMPEQAILFKHFCYFGPVPENLFRHIGNEDWCAALKAASESAALAVEEQPELRFTHWGSDLGPEAQDVISAMMSLDPAARPTIEQVMVHAWWREGE